MTLSLCRLLLTRQRGVFSTGLACTARKELLTTVHVPLQVTRKLRCYGPKRGAEDFHRAQRYAGECLLFGCSAYSPAAMSSSSSSCSSSDEATAEAVAEAEAEALLPSSKATAAARSLHSDSLAESSREVECQSLSPARSDMHRDASLSLSCSQEAAVSKTYPTHRRRSRADRLFRSSLKPAERVTLPRPVLLQAQARPCRRTDLLWPRNRKQALPLCDLGPPRSRALRVVHLQSGEPRRRVGRSARQKRPRQALPERPRTRNS